MTGFEGWFNEAMQAGWTDADQFLNELTTEGVGEVAWDCLDGLSACSPPDCYDDGYGTHANCGPVVVIPIEALDE